MTNEQIQDILLNYCDKEISSYNKSKLFLYRKRIQFSKTKIMESWEKEANLPLPKFIYFPKDSRSFKIDKIGIHYDKKIIPWLDIEMTALTVHHIDGGRHEHTIYNYFMAYCKNGQIINQEIGNISEYSNLLGHFIELYKDKQNKIANL